MHQIRREKRTTISQVIVRGKRNTNWVLLFPRTTVNIYLTILKRKNVSLPLKVETDQFVICLVLPVKSVFLSKFVAFHPRTVNRIVTALMPSLLFRCFSLFLPHLRTLTEGERLENCLRFGTGGSSLCLYSLLSRNILFFPTLTIAARPIKKISGEAICSRYQRALSEFWARWRILNLIARLC